MNKKSGFNVIFCLICIVVVGLLLLLKLSVLSFIDWICNIDIINYLANHIIFFRIALPIGLIIGVWAIVKEVIIFSHYEIDDIIDDTIFFSKSPIVCLALMIVMIVCCCAVKNRIVMIATIILVVSISLRYYGLKIEKREFVAIGFVLAIIAMLTMTFGSTLYAAKNVKNTDFFLSRMEQDNDESDSDTDKINSIISVAKEYRDNNNLDRAMEELESGLSVFPDSEALQDEYAEYKLLMIQSYQVK